MPRHITRHTFLMDQHFLRVLPSPRTTLSVRCGIPLITQLTHYPGRLPQQFMQAPRRVSTLATRVRAEQYMDHKKLMATTPRSRPQTTLTTIPRVTM